MKTLLVNRKVYPAIIASSSFGQASGGRAHTKNGVKYPRSFFFRIIEYIPYVNREMLGFSNLNVSRYLRYHKEETLEHYGINVKQHPKFPNLIQLTYDQIESSKNKSLPMVIESRGIILDRENNYNPVAYPFNRFFRIDEIHVDKLDWNSARVQEKLDGSMIIMYHYDSKWHVATKGSPDAGGSVGDFQMTFSELFWMTFVEMKLDLDKFPKDITFIWELTSPYNRIVVRYPENKLTLIGARSLLYPNYFECPVSLLAKEFPVVREFPVQTLEEIVLASKELDPMNQEGFVVVDGSFKRAKIKSPKYDLIHHMVDGFGVRRIIDLIKLGETSQILEYYPEFKSLFENISLKLDYTVRSTENAYEKIKHLENQKEFALEAVKNRHSGAMFALRNGSVSSIREAILNMPTNKIEDFVK